MRYADQGYTPAQVIAIGDAYLFANNLISDRAAQQKRIEQHIKPFGSKGGTIILFLPPWIRSFAPPLPTRPSPVLSKEIQDQIEALEQRKVDLNFKSVAINIGPEISRINAKISRLRNPDSQK